MLLSQDFLTCISLAELLHQNHICNINVIFRLLGSYFSSNSFFISGQEIPGASFTHIDGRRKVVEIDKNNLYPYLLVNIGSGVGIIKVIQHSFCFPVNQLLLIL